MRVYCICLIAIISYFIPTIQSENNCDDVFEDRVYNLSPGEERRITVNNKTHYNSRSLKWTFFTSHGEEYLSVYVSKFNLGTRECVVNGIPDYTRYSR